MIHDFRFNFSRVTEDAWAGVASNEQTAGFAAFSSSLPTLLNYEGSIVSVNPYSMTASSIAGVGQLVSATTERTYQDQLEGAYTLGFQRGAHDFRIGGDYIRLVPRTTLGNGLWTDSATAAGVQQLLAGDPLGVTISFGRWPRYSVGAIGFRLMGLTR